MSLILTQPHHLKPNTMAKKEETGAALSPNEEKLKALQAAMSKIEKDFGKGSIMKLGDEHIELSLIHI